MDGQQQPVQFEEFAAHLDAIFDQVEAHGKEIIVERGGKLFALRATRRRRRLPPKPRGLTPQDPLLEIIGLGGVMDDAGPTDVSANKHKYLAEAAVDLHETPPAARERHPGEPNLHATEDRDASEAV